MLSYESRIRDEFYRVKEFAAVMRVKFDTETTPEELLSDCNHLTVLCDGLEELLPEEIRDTTNLQRHLGWMQKNLRAGQPRPSRQDIEDICRRDLPTLQKGFGEWCGNNTYCDQELAEKTSHLVISRQYDSAIRRAFVILKSRMVAKFALPDTILTGRNWSTRYSASRGRLPRSSTETSGERCATC